MKVFTPNYALSTHINNDEMENSGKPKHDCKLKIKHVIVLL